MDANFLLICDAFSFYMYLIMVVVFLFFINWHYDKLSQLIKVSR